MNAKTELLEAIGSIAIKCAKIKYEKWGNPIKEFLLQSGYSENDLITFLNDLDFEYDDGYGPQEIEGTVWLKDGTWLERGEYDGSEWWEHRYLPTIPPKLL